MRFASNFFFDLPKRKARERKAKEKGKEKNEKEI
jgi:hypothetical protein